MRHFSAKLSGSAKEDRDSLMNRHILERLRFNSMEDRAERVPKAHRRTFDWIFRNPDGHPDRVRSSSASNATAEDFSRKSDEATRWSNFVHWLKSDSSLYWVTGKPGSGKSTLMKYLQSDPRTSEHLETWIGIYPIIVAGYFFWNSGTAVQMSKLGLLQTLLYGAISNNLDLVSVIFPRRWKSYQFFGGDLRDWSMTELIQAFQILISHDSMRFFFFIDGLDEFDGDGAELATFIFDSIASRSNIKFCVASRPWLVFEDAFLHRPSLRLEDLTAPDIQLSSTRNCTRTICSPVSTD
jgi:hypothetical protein